MRESRWFLLSGAVLVADRLTKNLALARLDYAEPVAVFPGLNWTLLYNPGAAFSFLSQAGGWQRWFFIVLAALISIVLAVAIVRAGARQWLSTCAMAMVLGGAIGNLWDRIQLGYVVDFIQVYYRSFYWPAFNVADSAISVGVVLLLLALWREPSREPSS